jgi:cytochrome c oxidase subunit 2
LRGSGRVGIVGLVEPAPRVRPDLLAVAVLVAGCAWEGPQSTLVPRSDFARAIADVYGLITGAVILIALVVSILLTWVLTRYRARPGAPEPRQTRGHTLLEIGWTVAPALVLLIIALPTIDVTFRTQRAPPEGALQVVVRGRQWWWEFRYPGLDVVTANELHLPVGRAAVIRLEGGDVIHSFWVPKLGGKRDVVPGRVNTITLTPEAPGEYPGQCAEFCGAAHALMGLRVIVDAPDAFQRWVAAQKAEPAQPTGPAADGKAVFARNACVGCHTIRGVSAGTLGPDLTHFGSRRTLAAGLLPNTLENVARWLRDPPALKPSVKMPNLGLSDADTGVLAAYLLSLK